MIPFNFGVQVCRICVYMQVSYGEEWCVCIRLPTPLPTSLRRPKQNSHTQLTQPNNYKRTQGIVEVGREPGDTLRTMEFDLRKPHLSVMEDKSGKVVVKSSGAQP